MIFKDLNITMNKYKKFYGKKIKIIFNNNTHENLIGYFKSINLPYDYTTYFNADNITISILKSSSSQNPEVIHVVSADLIQNVFVDNTKEILYKVSIIRNKLISNLNYDCFYHISSFIQEEYLSL